MARQLQGIRDSELSALEMGIRRAEREGAAIEVAALTSLRNRLLATMPPTFARRAEVDAEAVLEARGHACRPGPRAQYSALVLGAIDNALIPRLFGRMRIGGNIIWATDFREEVNTTSQGGGKGSGPKVTTTEYLYYASFAVALCEGEITGIGRVWADGKAMDMTGVTSRWYPGNEAQTADPFIAAKMGAANTPAYRGTAYVVFEELALSTYGNRLPQLSFEVFRPLADPDTADGLTRAVTMIPASGEFTYATQAIRKTDGGATVWPAMLPPTISTAPTSALARPKPASTPVSRLTRPSHRSVGTARRRLAPSDRSCSRYSAQRSSTTERVNEMTMGRISRVWAMIIAVGVNSSASDPSGPDRDSIR
jgi:hypothetical protein